MLLAFTVLYHVGLFGIPDVVLNFYYVSLGYSPVDIALLASVPRIAGLLSGLPVGLFSSRLGERRVLVISTLGAGACLALTVLVPSMLSLLIARFFLGFFYGAGQIVLSTLMLRSVRAERANLYFSVFNIISMTCMAFGNLIGGYLPTWLAGADFATSSRGYGSALLFCTFLITLSVIPLFGIVNAPQKRKTSDSLLTKIPYKLISFLCIPMLTFGFTGGLTFPFYNLLFRTTFSLPDQAIGQLLGFGSLSMALLPMLNPWLARRFGSSTALSILMLVASVAFFVLGAASGMGILATSIIAYLIAIGTRNTMQPLFQPLLMGRLAPELHNIGNSIAMVIWNVGWFTATAISGILQTQVGYPAIMIIVSVGVFITAISMFVIYRYPSSEMLQVVEV